MFRVLISTFCFAFATSALDNPALGPQGPLLIKVESCCAKNLLRHDEKDKEELKECFQMEKKPPTCDRDICIGVKKGYASSDGTMDKKVLQEILEKDFKDNTLALEAILENCINGDLSKFGREDFCELMKMNNCIEIQVIKSCDDWKESEDCKKLKTWVDTLIKKFD